MSTINYSIIIPNKNLSVELSRCLNSIPKRSDLEIIVIDDNSDPNILDFSNYPGKDIDNVKIIFSKTGKGAGAARNEGLKEAKGKWIIFIDSDDFLMPCADNIMDKYIDSKYDIIYFLPDSVYNDSLQPAHRHEEKCENLLAIKDNAKKLDFYLRYKYTEPWGKIIKRSLIENNDIIFQESSVANDYMFSIKTGYSAKIIHFDKTQFYCVTVREGSLCFSLFENEKKIFDRLQVYYDVQTFAIDHKINIRPFFLFVAQTIFHSKKSKPTLKKICQKNNLSYYKIILLAFVERLKICFK